MWIGNLNPGETEIEPFIGQNVVHDVSATGIAVTAVGIKSRATQWNVPSGRGLRSSSPPPTDHRGSIPIPPPNLFHGLQLESVVNVTVANNTIEQNQHAGIYLWKV